jgi:hypothetical protein
MQTHGWALVVTMLAALSRKCMGNARVGFVAPLSGARRAAEGMWSHGEWVSRGSLHA